MIFSTFLAYKARNLPQSFLNLFILIDLLLQTQIFHYTLAQSEISRSFFTPFNADNNWKSYYTMSSNHIKDCGTASIFGGPLVFNYQTTITKTFILPPHYKVYQNAIFQIGSLEWFILHFFFIDGQQAYKNNPNLSTGTEICGSGTLGEIEEISNTINHSGNSAIVTLISLQNSASWGISDFILSIYPCPIGCDNCDLSGNCQNWKKVLTFFNKTVLTDGEGWKSNYDICDGIYSCGSFQYYGKFQMTTILSVDLNLADPHTKVKIQFKFLCAYVTGSIIMRVDANGVLLGDSEKSFSIITTNDIICGSLLQLDNILLDEIISSDQLLTLYLKFSESPDPADSTHFFGMICNDINIIAFDGCNEGCSNCVKGLCTQCLSYWILNTILGQCVAKCGDKIVVSEEQCDDGNQQPYDGCYECKFSCPLNCMLCQFGGCLICNQPYELIDNQCEFTCYLDENENLSLSLYPTQKAEGHYCQISNFLSNIYTQHIIINTDLQLIYDSNQCSIFNYGIFAYQYQLCVIETPQNCRVSFFSICSICDDNFELSNNLLCVPICGDGVIQEYESCDDTNEQQFDGCYQCQSMCQLECLQCIASQCYKCMDGSKLINFKCVSECGDGLIALLQNEQCDDQNNESNDGCFECKFECSQNCILCNLNLDCFQCQKYYEPQNKVCTPICGDGIVIEEFEQCDDGNDIQDDGCYKCQFSCIGNCQICDQQKCLDPQIQQCKDDGYYLIDNQCLSICGDLIIASNEQCEDANEIPFDECYQCEYSCPLNCFDCNKGQCLYCDDGYQISNNLCIGICGDGSKLEIEECDDFNLISQDGCSDKCEIEINWACTAIDFETSQCLQNKPPHFNLLFINQTYDSQFIQLQITSKVKLHDSYQNLTKSLKAFLVDVNPLDYIIYQEAVVEPNAIVLQDIYYLFQIQLLKQVTK
ncbi:unnamed protein product (macronuclear) [Paramecium tetraurelia]|uniref:TNFR-Cys domain-containing protein n=1 Tax=Paramecium tetraurelia TaxID=5888 RepID=A0BR48_PARTE|nr:uncharacterized protein GSPATT00031244001 [Paramecium tetraurelia]CAK61015.1 unnamed protein product [Paramecium tetraurelia]|eukprot:XP_001428413.1 hypothetical protein (macronuclear) [Paramecium tetraurelia strain d4-2]